MEQPRNLEQANKLVGKKIKVINMTGGHNLPKGTIVTITGTSWGNPCYFYHDASSSSLQPKNMELVAQTIKELEKEKKLLISTHKKELNTINNKLVFLKETKGKEFDEDEFKAYTALTIFEGTDSKLEKAKLIANLIK